MCFFAVLCYFAEINEKRTQISAKILWMKLAVCRRSSERFGFFMVLWFLLKSMIIIHNFLMKVCGGNWPSVGEDLRGPVSLLLCGFC